jgi:myosin heavy subunit
VSRINKATNHPHSARRKVGLLDIFGFEDFAVNSFEQVSVLWYPHHLKFEIVS